MPETYGDMIACDNPFHAKRIESQDLGMGSAWVYNLCGVTWCIRKIVMSCDGDPFCSRALITSKIHSALDTKDYTAIPCKHNEAFELLLS